MMQHIYITSERMVLNMQSLPADCWACGENASGRQCGIPVYEDMILPNDWQGEWGGAPACRECFLLQSTLIEPMARAKFRTEIAWQRKKIRRRFVRKLWA